MTTEIEFTVLASRHADGNELRLDVSITDHASGREITLQSFPLTDDQWDEINADITQIENYAPKGFSIEIHEQDGGFYHGAAVPVRSI